MPEVRGDSFAGKMGRVSRSAFPVFERAGRDPGRADGSGIDYTGGGYSPAQDVDAE